MRSDVYAVWASIGYVLIAVGLTYWLARTLFRSGTAFLRDVFEGKPELAEAVNRLLVVGFYMLNLGYALYILRASRQLDGFASVQFLVDRLALLLVTLAFIHFINVLVFWRIRIHREQRDMPSPILPAALIPPTPNMPTAQR